MTRDEQWLKSMIDHPAGKRAHRHDDELDMTFIDMANEAYEDNRGRFRWSWGLVGHALTGVAVIAIFYINLVYLSGVGL